MFFKCLGSRHIQKEIKIQQCIQRTPVNLISLVQEKNIIISGGLSDYPVTMYY